MLNGLLTDEKCKSYFKKEILSLGYSGWKNLSIRKGKGSSSACELLSTYIQYWPIPWYIFKGSQAKDYFLPHFVLDQPQPGQPRPRPTKLTLIPIQGLLYTFGRHFLQYLQFQLHLLHLRCSLSLRLQSHKNICIWNNSPGVGGDNIAWSQYNALDCHCGHLLLLL